MIKNHTIPDTELKINRLQAIVYVSVNISSHLFKFLTVAVLAYFGYMSIDALSGEITDAEFIVGLFSDEHFAEIVCLLAGIAGVFYGHRQARLRKKIVEKYHEYMQNKEAVTELDGLSNQLDAGADSKSEENP